MADGLSATNANTALTNWTTSAVFIQLHTGDPGSAGTSNVSSTTTREAVTWGTASAGSITASNTPAWPSWAGTNNEVVTDISFWSASTSGTFEFSITLSSSATMATTDTLSITPITITLPTAS